MCLHATPTVSGAACNDHHMLTLRLLPALEHMEPTVGASYLAELWRWSIQLHWLIFQCGDLTNSRKLWSTLKAKWTKRLQGSCLQEGAVKVLGLMQNTLRLHCKCAGLHMKHLEVKGSHLLSDTGCRSLSMVLNWHLPTNTLSVYNTLVHTEHFHVYHGRIWPFNDSPCIFPDDVVLCEYEKRPVDGEAVLPVGNGIVQSHGPGPLRLGLFHGSCESRRRRVLRVSAALHVPIPGVHRGGSGLISKASHSTKRRGDGRLRLFYYRRTSGKEKRKSGATREMIHLQSADSCSSAEIP